MADSTADWHHQAGLTATFCRRHLRGLIAVYVHGSAALGGMTPASDLDMLVIAETEDGAADLGASLLATASQPRVLELSVVTATAARDPKEPWPFAVHVNTAENRVEAGSTTNGDPDLIAHYAVTRAAGVTLLGPEPRTTIGETEPEQLLSYLRSELQWGLDHGDQRYAVLNACRASAYKSTGRLVSKLDGATWWAQTHGPNQVVTRAQDAQTAGVDLGPATLDATAFVTDRIAELARPC